MDQKSLVIKTHPSNIEIDYSGSDIVKITIHNDMDLHIAFDNNVMLETKGDFTIISKGELGLISMGSPLCLDSVDSIIHMNYRQSKHLVNLPESAQYREELDKENQKCIELATMQEMQTKTLKERVSELETIVKNLHDRFKFLPVIK